MNIGHSHKYEILGKGKAVPLQAWIGPEGSRKLMFPDFMTTAQEGGKIVRLTHRPHLPPMEILLVLISVRGWVHPRAIVRSEELCQWKISMTSSGIELANSRFVAQRLNHCATAVPEILVLNWNVNQISIKAKKKKLCIFLSFFFFYGELSVSPTTNHHNTSHGS